MDQLTNTKQDSVNQSQEILAKQRIQESPLRVFLTKVRTFSKAGTE